jgi:hypothetical protein
LSAERSEECSKCAVGKKQASCVDQPRDAALLDGSSRKQPGFLGSRGACGCERRRLFRVWGLRRSRKVYDHARVFSRRRVPPNGDRKGEIGIVGWWRFLHYDCRFSGRLGVRRLEGELSLCEVGRNPSPSRPISLKPMRELASPGRLLVCCGSYSAAGDDFLAKTCLRLSKGSPFGSVLHH